ncbi:MAG: SpoIIE family protein phosphatase [Muribaculaceae bacterium]|nr:SpoIIE family protein phosphatase [Muribaculaceae bacterium]
MARNRISQIKRSINTNSIVLIIAAALILEIISTIQYQYVREEIAVDLHLRAQSELLAKSLAIQNVMSQVEAAVGNHVWDAQRLISEGDSAFSVVKRLVEQNPNIKGSSFSFMPDYYPDKGYWFESYAVRRDSDEIELMQLGSADHDYTQAEFYKIPIETDSARWTDPYLDNDGARMILTTFSIPVHDATKKPVAVLDADISLDWLKSILDINYVNPSSYNILISRSGQLMSYPQDEYVMLKTINDVAKEKQDPAFTNFAINFVNGERGNAVFKDNDGEKYHVFYAPVGGETGWSLAVVSSEKEIFGNYNKMKGNLLILRIIALAVLIFIIFRSVRNINKLQKITVERERIKSELQIASQIQDGMLPDNITVDFNGAKVEVVGLLNPAKEVGGDLYDFFVKDDRLYFCIGDVSGKGVPAAMFMTVTRSLFRTIAPYTLKAAKILWYMNRTMANINETNMFVTFFVGIYDMKTRRLNYSNGGHNGPVIIENGIIKQLEVIPNLPLGVFPDFDYAEQETSLEKDSMIFLYTDGLTEAMNLNKQEFGEERMIDALRKFAHEHKDLTPNAILEGMKDKIKDFVDKAEQSDDLTMLSIKIKDTTEKPMKNALKIENKISAIKQLNEFVDNVCKENLFSEENSMQLKLVIEETVANIINYGYPDGSSDEIDISLIISEGNTRIEIKDHGLEFDPTKVNDADVDGSVEERPIGGLGIFLVRQFTDDMHYKRENNTNILVLNKKIK